MRSEIILVLADVALMQLEAGCTALKAVFSSKLIGKGKCLAELLQPHSTGTYTHSHIYTLIDHYSSLVLIETIISLVFFRRKCLK